MTARPLYDSCVICEYLDTLHDGRPMFPESGTARWAALRLQALGDGIMDAALLARYETFLRPGTAALAGVGRRPARQGPPRARPAGGG